MRESERGSPREWKKSRHEQTHRLFTLVLLQLLRMLVGISPRKRGATLAEVVDNHQLDDLAEPPLPDRLPPASPCATDARVRLSECKKRPRSPDFDVDHEDIPHGAVWERELVGERRAEEETAQLDVSQDASGVRWTVTDG